MARKKKATVEALIDPTMEMATTASEGGVVGFSPIDDALYADPVLSAGEEAMVDALNETTTEHDHGESVAVMANESNDGESFTQVMANLDEAKVDETVMATAAAFDDRAAFEDLNRHPNIQRTLKKARAVMVTKRAARVMLATAIDPAVINRSIHEGARYNVYAIGKLADVIYGLTGGEIANAINRACMKSLFQISAAGKDFTGELAKAAASDKVRVDATLRKFLVSHTVSASTAPTQASSTMQAFETLGIVKREGSSKNPTFKLTGNPIVAAVKDRVMPKAA